MIRIPLGMVRLVLSGLCLSLGAGCSGNSNNNESSGGAAGNASVGGTTSNPSTSNGGSTPAAGGASSTTSPGGTASTGGNSASPGGAANAGGNTSLPGGAASTGGSSASPGGSANIGGSTSLPGGAASTGGSSASPGGSASIGGSTSLPGGAASAGGSSASPGGSASIGGQSGAAGHSATGGVSSPGGAGSTGGGSSSGWQSGCLMRLGGLPELAPPGVGDVGDFNGDGVLDVVLGPISGYAVRVLLGRGNGVYGDAVSYDCGGSPRAIAVGDLDGDGILDIATRNSDNSNIAILKGAGNGTFSLSKTVNAGSDSGGGFPKQNLILADITGDGRLDILTAHWDQTIAISIATSTGSFIPLSPIAVGRPVTQVAVADLNKDTVPDIVVNNGMNNVISVLLGTGGGTFASKVDYPLFTASTWYADSLALGDVNKDGNVDVIVGNGAAGSIAVLTNSGNGTLSSPVATNVSGSVGYVNNVQLTDLEGDGDLDLLVNVSGDGALYYLWNNGSGSFTTITRDYVGDAGIDIHVLDSNGDGTKDLFLFGNKFLTLLGRGGGKFESQKFLLADSGTKPRSVAVGNFDGTGVMDVAFANEGSNSTGIFLLDANGNYSVPTGYTVGTQPALVRGGDVTGDGKADLVVLNYGGTINVLRNGGSGTFTVLTGFNVLPARRWFDLKDVNEDGTLDVVMLGATTACLYPGTGTGAFGTCIPFTVSNGSAMEAMVLGDVNGDGHLDAVASGNSNLYTWLGNGDGTFHSTPDFYNNSTLATASMALGDLNGDQKVDLAVAQNTNSSYATLSVWLGGGDGTFTANKSYFPGGVLARVQIADMNRDGNGDIVSANSQTNSLVVMLGNGDGTFAANYFSYPAGESPMDFALADLNNDGYLDAATPGYDSGSGGVLFGGPPACPTE